LKKDKPISFGDLEGQFPKGVPGYLSQLVATQYALGIHNVFANSWNSRLNTLIDSGSVDARNLDVLEAAKLFLGFQNELEQFRTISINKVRQANTQAKVVEKSFYLLKDVISQIPELKTSWSKSDLDLN